MRMCAGDLENHVPLDNVMPVTAHEKREKVRLVYRYCCGYYGVHEAEAGSELEIDHFQPRSRGGEDELENLVYCCPACNRRKGDFWAAEGFSATRRLLHPRRDNLSAHLRQEIDGRVTALTDTGAFHVERLQLNRPPLVALRRTRSDVASLRQALAAARGEQTRLQRQIARLELVTEEVLAQLSRLSGRSL